MTSFKKCPIDGYDMDKTYEEKDDSGKPITSNWTCRGCGFIGLFNLEYTKGLDKKPVQSEDRCPYCKHGLPHIHCGSCTYVGPDHYHIFTHLHGTIELPFHKMK